MREVVATRGSGRVCIGYLEVDMGVGNRGRVPSYRGNITWIQDAIK
jgi:hypothetical protein